MHNLSGRLLDMSGDVGLHSGLPNERLRPKCWSDTLKLDRSDAGADFVDLACVHRLVQSRYITKT